MKLTRRQVLMIEAALSKKLWDAYAEGRTGDIYAYIAGPALLATLQDVKLSLDTFGSADPGAPKLFKTLNEAIAMARGEV